MKRITSVCPSISHVLHRLHHATGSEFALDSRIHACGDSIHCCTAGCAAGNSTHRATHEKTTHARHSRCPVKKLYLFVGAFLSNLRDERLLASRFSAGVHSIARQAIFHPVRQEGA